MKFLVCSFIGTFQQISICDTHIHTNVYTYVIQIVDSF